MKRMLKGLPFALVAATLVIGMAACGGGGGGAKKSGLSTNGFFGAIPAVYADHSLAFDAILEKRDKAKEKAVKAQNAKALMKAEEQYDKAYDELDAQYEADRKAAWDKIKGKDVEFSVSSQFNAFTVNSVKVADDESSFVIDVSDIKTPSNIFGIIHFSYKALAKDGTVISDPRRLVLSKDTGRIPVYLSQKPETWVDFAKIEFIADDE